MRYALIIFLSLLLFVMMAGIVVLLNNTLVSKPLFYTCIVAVGVFTVPFFAKNWQRLTRLPQIWINYMVHVIVVAIAAGFLFLAVNYFCAGTPEQIRGEVVRRYQKTRYYSRRVGRRSYAQGSAYQVYFIEVDIPDWGKRSFEVPLSKYNRLRPGSAMNMAEARGGLGLRVITL